MFNDFKVDFVNNKNRIPDRKIVTILMNDCVRKVYKLHNIVKPEILKKLTRRA